MSAKQLKNKPLVEAILEMKWDLKGSQHMRKDPHYKILLGRLFDRLESDYPHHEQLPSASIPDEMAEYIVQHQFRVKEDGWPLTQVGPGILTVNETEGYTWGNFSSRVKSTITKFFKSYPASEDLKINNLLLRYINAIEFDYKDGNLASFLKDNMSTKIELPKKLFSDEEILEKPIGLNWIATYPIKTPGGVIHLKLATGKKKDKPALVLELSVQSAGKDIPNMPDNFNEWFESAHNIIEDWFFKIIEGDLEKRFS